MRYRVENVFIPESGGIAIPGGQNDKHQDLEGRRIVHVISVEPHNGGGGVLARVLTEEGEPAAEKRRAAHLISS